MSPCPECRSDDVYEYQELVDSSIRVGELLPKLAPSHFAAAKILPVVCASCGYLRLFADEDAREKLRDSKDWRRT